LPHVDVQLHAVDGAKLESDGGTLRLPPHAVLVGGVRRASHAPAAVQSEGSAGKMGSANGKALATI
jgi:hypothetical protein